CPPAIQECRDIFDRVYAPKSAENSSQQYYVRATLKFDGIMYSRASTHLGNSQILFYPRGDQTLTPVPASIKYIYGTLMGELSFAAQRYLPPDCHDGMIDPFSIYPDFTAKMYSMELESRLENVKVTWAVSHFARWTVSTRHAVILSLSRD
ncbi:hypothetical protein DFJ58DRAFT_671028, partial [Suillus subalutaceus]|uniref:uncharacterized protein n=1 Tax=Suillus subalutaceus TaxID=48586 RepID=UPI001B87DC82